jgi:polar amino acid transport system substrate-binding protein
MRTWVTRAFAGRLRSSALITTTAAAAAGLALAGCSSSGSTTASAPASTSAGSAGSSSPVSVASDAAAAALLPASIKSAGVLKIAVPDTGAPLAETTNGSLVGMDPAFAAAVAGELGLKASITQVPFAQALVGLQDGRYDLSYGEFYVTPPRQKVADFVTDWKTFSSFLTQKTSSFAPKSLADVCGQTVGGMSGSVELSLLQGEVAACKSAGKPLTVNAYPNYGAAILALGSGRIQGILNDRGAEELTIKAGQPFKVSGQVAGGPTAVAIRRSAADGSLADAVQKAYEALIANGQYAKILGANGTSYGAITAPVIYTATTTPPNYG